MDVDNFGDAAGPSSRPFQRAAFDVSRNPNESHNRQPNEQHFEIFAWYPHYQRCLRYFLDHAQHTQQVQTLAAFVNISLPCQRRPPIVSSRPPSPHSPGLPLGMGMGVPPQMSHPNPNSAFPNLNLPNSPPLAVSLIPYIRRLVATGFDAPNILRGFFGDNWQEGIGPMHEVERRNYLFATKSGSWLEVKAEYDISPHESVPFLKPLQHATEAEISSADKQWSDWLAMQDWMVGPRAPDAMDPSARAQEARIRREPQD
jgi:hypothetical protein